MVEKDSRARIEPIGLAVIRDFPKRGRLSHGVGAAWSERCVLIRGGRSGVAETLAGTGVVKLNRAAGEANRFQEIQSSLSDAESFDRLLKREADRALASQVVDLIWLDLHYGLENAAKIAEGYGFEQNPIFDSEESEVIEWSDLSIP
jgi:hypothetical protein